MILSQGSWHTKLIPTKSKLENMNEIFRKSYNTTGKIYFFTATIHKWYSLLAEDNNQQLIVDYLGKLSSEGFITVYGFVIMPNHIHIIWKQNKLNGKETPQGSFLKFTAHEFLKKLKAKKTSFIYEVNMANKKHEIWQRDSLSVEIYSQAVAKQKLDYIHFNPVSKKWTLSKNDLDYYYSSARFYENGLDEFGFLNNLYTVFDGE
jgi:putative transposase